MAKISPRSLLRRDVFFIDASLPDLFTLTSALPANAEIHLIDATQDGLEQIALTLRGLQGESGIDAIHIFSHGSAGELSIGSTRLSSYNINSYAATLSQIGSSLSPSGDILLYGCNVGAGAEGLAFVESVARLTQADVAASDDVTGSAALGGDWVLEVKSGVVETAVVSADAYSETFVDTTVLTLLTQLIVGEPSLDEAYRDVQCMADGNLLVAGYNSQDALLTAVTSSGDILWTKTYGGTSRDYFFNIEATPDGGYIAIGATLSYGVYRDYQFVVKTDANGNQEWLHNYGGMDAAIGFAATPTTDGGYIIAGPSTETDAWFDIRLTKVAANGNEQWVKFFGRSLDDTAHDVIQTSDGGYVITGLSGGHSSSTPMWIIKTDGSGNQLWNQLIGGTGNGGIGRWYAWDRAYQVREMSDNSLVVAGTMYNSSNALDAVLLKLDSTGNMVWTHYYGGVGNDQFYDFVKLSNGGFALVGSTESNGNGSEVFLVTTDSEGNETKHIAFGGTGNELGYGITLLSDSVVAIAGSTQAVGQSTYNGLFATVSLYNSNETFIGHPWDDVYYVDSTGDKVIEKPNEGNDTVNSSITYDLPANVENLILTGSSAINGNGNIGHLYLLTKDISFDNLTN